MKPFRQYLGLAVLIALVGMHIPFLKADPDAHISISRDANTDEGLYSYQIRNFVNHGDLSLQTSDCLLKTPLFGALLLFPFKVLGTKFLVGRLTVLLVVIVLCAFVFGYNDYFYRLGLISLALVFTEFYIFHYSHYCMADMISTVFIFLGLFHLIKRESGSNIIKSSFLSATFVSGAYFLKLQFLYATVILPMALVLFIAFAVAERKLLVRQLLLTTGFLVLYLVIYFLVWYWPHIDFFEYVLNDQTSNRFAFDKTFMNQLNNNFRFVFLNDYLRIYTYAFCLLYVVGLINSYFTKSTIFRTLFIVLTCWMALESHKLAMTYLPSRYLISLLFAMGLIMSLVINEFLFSDKTGIMATGIKIFSMVILLVIGLKNINDYRMAYDNRAFAISNTDTYLSRFQFGSKPVIGAWAASLSWKSKAYTFPIWKNYFNDTSVLNSYQPAMIISELDEEDSNQAFLSRGIEVDNYADSIKYISVNHWKLKMLWINSSLTETMPVQK